MIKETIFKKLLIKKSLLTVIISMLMVVICLSSTIAYGITFDPSASLSNLQQLGIIDSDKNDGNVAITRGEFAKAIVKASMLSDAVKTKIGATIYPDVDANSEISGYVNLLKDKGLMYGMADGYFHEELPITYGEACTILVKLLGYGDSDVTGTWPNNYISKANDLEITQGLAFKKSNELPLWAAVVMIDRTLSTNVKGQTNKTFVASVGLYEDYIILDNSMTSSILNEGEIITDKGTFYLEDPNKILNVGDTYRLSVSDNTIKSIYEKSENTLSIVVDNYLDNAINYTKNGESKKINLPSQGVYYYHGIKQNYTNLSNIIKSNMSLVLGYNKDKNGFQYIVINDPIYSDPEIASGYDIILNRIGRIRLDDKTPIYKNGELISKFQIKKLDVVYEATDVNGNNRFIQVYDNRAEGYITEFLPSESVAASGIQVDKVNYEYGKYMDLKKTTQFKLNDKVAAILGYDGKVVDVQSIVYKTNYQIEVKILGNSKTSDNISESQVLTDMGTFNIIDEDINLDIGGKYKVYADENNILGINKKISSEEAYSVAQVSGSTIFYSDKDGDESYNLPKTLSYYYNGEKKDLNSILSLIQYNSTVIIAKNSGNNDYAVILDPILKRLSSKGDVDSDSVILREGQKISKSEIEEDDILYKSTDIYGIKEAVLVFYNRVEGNITAFLSNGSVPTGISIDGKNLNYGKDMDLNVLSNYSASDKIAAVLGFDGKIIEIKKINYKSGPYVKCIILANSRTSSNLAYNQVLTSLGTYFVLGDSQGFEIGGQYNVVIDGDAIVKFKSKSNSIETYSVYSKTNSTIYYSDYNITRNMILPNALTYYYNGTKKDYSAAVSLIKSGSSIILSRNASNTGYEYGVIVDPIYSEPYIYNYSYAFPIEMTNLNTSFIIKNGNYLTNLYQISYKDVVYKVSDIWGRFSYIMVVDTKVTGKITAFTPNKFEMTSIQINNVNYELDENFDKNLLQSYSVGNSITLILGNDGKVLQIY